MRQTCTRPAGHSRRLLHAAGFALGAATCSSHCRPTHPALPLQSGMARSMTGSHCSNRALCHRVRKSASRGDLFGSSIHAARVCCHCVAAALCRLVCVACVLLRPRCQSRGGQPARRRCAPLHAGLAAPPTHGQKGAAGEQQEDAWRQHAPQPAAAGEDQTRVVSVMGQATAPLAHINLSST